MAPVLALLVLGLTARGVEAQPGRAIRFERLSTDQGLSQSTVMCVLQDSRGFMWFGTEAGLNRYDGRDLVVYRHDVHDAGSLPSDFVWALAEDAAADLWVATQGGGLARWERATDRFVRYPSDPAGKAGSPSRQLRTVLVDRDGLVWIGTKDAGLARLDPARGLWRGFRHEASDPASLPNDSVHALRLDGHGGLWVGTEGGLARLDASAGRFQFIPRQGAEAADGERTRIRDIREDRRGQLWVATAGEGLLLLAPGGDRLVHVPRRTASEAGSGDEVIHALFEDSAGRFWLGTRAGLQLREADGSFSTYRNDPSDPRSLGDSDVLSIFEDGSGVLWFGTRAGGTARFNPRTWAFGLVRPTPGRADGLANGYVTSFAEDARGTLWVGTMGGGLHAVDRASGRIRRYARGDAGLADERVMSLLVDRRGQLWAGTMEGGLQRFDATSGRFVNLALGGERSVGIVTLHEDARGLLWVGTFGGGLLRVDETRRSVAAFLRDPADPTSLSRNVVTAIAEDRSGALWVGTEGGGLNLLDPQTGRFRHFVHDPDDPESIADDTVYSLLVDANGTLWAGTRSGLSRLEPGAARMAFRSYTSADGLAGNVVYGIQADEVGRLWLSGSQGLLRFDPRTGVFRRYSASQGLQGDEFNFGAHYRSPRGELLFGGPEGFNLFRPEPLEANSVPPRVALVAFLRFNQPVTGLGPAYGLRRLDLSYRDAVVSFDFAVLDYAAPERNRLAYKLEGFDQDWIDLGHQRRVTLTNLDAGNYTLRVRAANADGTWNEEGLALPMRVTPAPWRSRWAYAFYALCAFAAVGVAVRARRREAAREAEYRRRLELEVEQRTVELGQRNVELEEVNSRLAEVSLTDSLTGLRNRRYLFEQVTKDVGAVQRQHTAVRHGLSREASQLVFIMIDLDWFKPINDTCGHAAGDRLLLQVRDILERACRSSDVLIRWGGDEFLVVGRAADLEHFDVVPERIRTMIERTPFELGAGQVAHVTCSIGFTAYPAAIGELETLSLDQIVSLADQALYAAKRAGRNTWVGYLATGETDVPGLLRSLQSDPEGVLHSGIEVRRPSTSGSPNREVTASAGAASTDHH